MGERNGGCVLHGTADSEDSGVLPAPAWRILSPDELLPKLRQERVREQHQVTQ